MKLTVPERLHLLSILPGEGDIVTMKVVRDLLAGVSFTDEETVEYELIQTATQVTWNVDTIKEVEVEIGTKAMSIIVDALQKLDADKKFTLDTVALYDKFVT
ncbi:hypothetical protein LCGC14_1387250 [marine sediment metagenome]|uniref:Uncharacterized protein n=1 Tax=marine sediment metagenome TaxID=412755 RepID=A0A0F9MGJ0_9ZZZZ